MEQKEKYRKQQRDRRLALPAFIGTEASPQFAPQGQENRPIHGNEVRPGSDAHVRLMDLDAACNTPDEREIMRLNRSGYDNEAIGADFGMSQWTVARKISEIKRRAR